MGMIEEVGSYLVASTGIGTLGTDVFLNVLPESAGVTVALIEGEGQAPGYTMSPARPAFTFPTVEVLVRSTVGPTGIADPTNARTRIQRVYNRLQAVTNQTLGSSTYLSIMPNGEPYLADRDQQGRVVFACSFTVTRRGTTGV